jgi:hypothetical protein
MRASTALLAMLVPVVGAGGWLTGRTAGEMWRASARPSGEEEEPATGASRSPIDLVVEYEPPVDEIDVAAEPPRARSEPEVLELVPIQPRPTVMQRLLALQERIEQSGRAARPR